MVLLFSVSLTTEVSVAYVMVLAIHVNAELTLMTVCSALDMLLHVRMVHVDYRCIWLYLLM